MSEPRGSANREGEPLLIQLPGKEGLDRSGAARAVKESDAARHDYLRRFYDLKDELPTQYDLVLNTDVLSGDRAVQLIAFAASSDAS